MWEATNEKWPGYNYHRARVYGNDGPCVCVGVDEKMDIWYDTEATPGPARYPAHAPTLRRLDACSAHRKRRQQTSAVARKSDGAEGGKQASWGAAALCSIKALAYIQCGRSGSSRLQGLGGLRAAEEDVV